MPRTVWGILREQKGMVIQALIFDKGKFGSVADAKKWATQHDFLAAEVEEADDSFKILQKAQARFMDGTFQRIQLTDGVKAVLGKMSEALTMETAPFWVQEMPPAASDAWVKTWNSCWEKYPNLEDSPRMQQASFEADEAVRAMGWVRGPGGWMNDKEPAPAQEAALPDSAFAVVEAGGRDSGGRTTPHELRHLPHHKADGSVDLARIRETWDELQESKMETDLRRRAQAHLQAHAAEAGIRLSDAPAGGGKELDYRINLKEAKYDGKAGEVIAVLIEAGTNYAKKRHYPKATVEKAAPEFVGLKMYVNHPTDREDAERPERDLRTWVATIKESWPENGKAMARIAVHDKWLKELLEDDTARAHVGLSINCRGEFYTGSIDGQQMQIVEKIIVEKGPRMSSVDWVTEPGARGRVVSLLESIARGGDMAKELKDMTLEELREARPDLVKTIESGARVTAPAAEVIEAAAKAGREAAEKRHAELVEADRQKLVAKGVLESQLKGLIKEAGSRKDSMLSEVSQQRVLENLIERTFSDEKAMKSAVESAVVAEAAYVKKIGGARISTGGTGAGGAETLTESIQGMLEDRAGLKEPAKKE